MYLSRKSVLCAGAFALALFATPMFAATNFVQVNLVADVAGVAAVTDPNLVGTWGISESSGSPFWVSNTGNGTSTLYTVTDANPSTLTMPTINTATVVVIPPSASNKTTKV